MSLKKLRMKIFAIKKERKKNIFLVDNFLLTKILCCEIWRMLSIQATLYSNLGNRWQDVLRKIEHSTGPSWHLVAILVFRNCPFILCLVPKNSPRTPKIFFFFKNGLLQNVNFQWQFNDPLPVCQSTSDMHLSLPFYLLVCRLYYTGRVWRGVS